MSGPVLTDYNLGAFGGEAVGLLMINGLAGSFSITLEEPFFETRFPLLLIDGKLNAVEQARATSKTPADRRPDKQGANKPASTRVQ